MIKKLYIRDFRNIKELIIEPSEYVNLISGNNGEGKSSILYAIEYCLTDNLNEKISEYVRWGCDKFFLEMTFDHSGSEYVIKIEGDKTAKKELKVDGNTYKNSEATKKLAEIIDPNIIRYSSISEQGKTAQILFDTPANRLKKLKEILGIDKISELCQDLKEDIDKKQIEINLHDKEMKVLEDKTYNFITVEKLPNIEDIKSKFDILEKDKKNYDLQSVIYETYLKDKKLYEDSIINLNTYDKETKQFKDKIVELESSQKTHEDNTSVDDLNEKIINLEKEQIQIQNEREAYQRISLKIQSLRSSILSESNELLLYPLRRLSTCKYTNEDLLIVEDLLTKDKINIASVKKSLQLAKEGKCPTCGQDYIVNADELKVMINALQFTILDNEEKIKEIKKEIEDYNKSFNEQEKIKIRRQNCQNKIDDCQSELDGLLNGFIERDLNEPQVDYRNTISSLQKKIKDHNAVNLFNVNISNEVRDFKNKIETNIKLSEQFRKVLLPVEVNEPEMYDHVEYEFLKSEILIYDARLKDQEKLIAHNEKIEEEKESDKLKIKSLISFIDSISYKVGILKESRQILDKDFSAWLIDQGAEYLKEKMNEFFSNAYGKYEITFSQDKNSIDFFYSDGDNISPCSMASGHEQKVLAVGFRIALSSLNNIGLMMLDEVDSDGSGERSLQLYEAILSNMSGTQFFAISHSEETKEMLLQQHGSKEFNVVNGMIN